MNNIKTCIIIEDQPPAQRILQRYIGNVSDIELLGTYNNAIDAHPILEEKKVDILFLDIHLPKLSGIDFLKSLKNPPLVILTTAFSEYALESYEYRVVDYLLKPFSFQRFIKAIEKASSVLNSSNLVENTDHSSEILFIKSGYDFIKVNCQEIHFIKSDSDYTELVTSDKKHLSSDTLKVWKKRLEHSFIQVHKSYLINTNKVKRVSSSFIYLENELQVPIGRVYREAVKNFWNLP